MIERLDRKKINTLPKAVKSDGLYCCPYCWHVMCEPIEGKGSVAMWCRRCRRHVIVKLDE